MINDWIRAGFGVTVSVERNRQKSPDGAAMLLPRKGPFGLYGLNGMFMGSFKSLDNAKKVLPHGLYLLGSGTRGKVVLLNR